MVCYIDPLEDPRIKIDYPRKPKHRVRLTPEQFKTDRAAGKLIVARSVKGSLPKRFIEAGITRFRKEGPAELTKLVRGRVRELVRTPRGSTKLTVVL